MTLASDLDAADAYGIIDASAHPPGAETTDAYPDPECFLCRAGVCRQRVIREGAEMVIVHGVVRQ